MYVGATNKPVGMPKPDCDPPQDTPENKPIMIDGFLSTTSTNPVQNRVVTDAIKSIKKLTKVTIDDSLDKYNKKILEDIQDVIRDGITTEIESGVFNEAISDVKSGITELDNKYNLSINDILTQITELKSMIESGGGGGGGDDPTQPDEPIYTPITATLTADPAGGTYKLGDTITPKLTWTASRVPKSVTLTDCVVTSEDIANKGGSYEVTPINNNKTYILKVGDGTTTTTKTVVYKFSASYYYGVSNTDDPNLIDLTTLTSGIEDGTDHSIRITSEAQYIVFVTPLEILSIKDANNFENINDFKETKVNDLYYYITRTPKTLTKYKYIFISQED